MKASQRKAMFARLTRKGQRFYYYNPYRDEIHAGYYKGMILLHTSAKEERLNPYDLHAGQEAIYAQNAAENHAVFLPKKRVFSTVSGAKRFMQNFPQPQYRIEEIKKRRAFAAEARQGANRP